MLKGAIHIHSTYSDGEFTLAELRDVYSAAGYDFVCMTDHAEYFDRQKLQGYLEQCRALSDDRFRFIAGLEYTCDNRMHVLGFGVTSPVATTNPQEVIRHIKSENGLSVIAHPMDSHFEWIESFDALPDGIETWNSKYDGRQAPRPGTFSLLSRLQKRSPHMRAFYGQDLHWKTQFRGPAIMVRCASGTRDEVLAAMSRGDYFALKGELQMPSSGLLPEELMERFRVENSATHRRRRLMKKAKKMIDRLGLSVPAPIKAQLRRIF
jgi:predicted metal-dependent phosphoesterase TrpH